MHWCDVDGARMHLSDGQTKRNRGTNEVEPIVSRKTVYRMVEAGLRVAPRGDSGKRFWFCTEWIDEFLQSRAAGTHQVQIKRSA